MIFFNISITKDKLSITRKPKKEKKRKKKFVGHKPEQPSPQPSEPQDSYGVYIKYVNGEYARVLDARINLNSKESAEKEYKVIKEALKYREAFYEAHYSNSSYTAYSLKNVQRHGISKDVYNPSDSEE